MAYYPPLNTHPNMEYEYPDPEATVYDDYGYAVYIPYIAPVDDGSQKAPNSNATENKANATAPGLINIPIDPAMVAAPYHFSFIWSDGTGKTPVQNWDVIIGIDTWNSQLTKELKAHGT